MSPTPVDPRALREQLSLSEDVDVRSTDFLRFVVRLSEALDRDIPPHEYPRLATLSGCFDYVLGTSEVA